MTTVAVIRPSLFERESAHQNGLHVRSQERLQVTRCQIVASGSREAGLKYQIGGNFCPNFCGTKNQSRSPSRVQGKQKTVSRLTIRGSSGNAAAGNFDDAVLGQAPVNDAILRDARNAKLASQSNGHSDSEKITAKADNGNRGGNNSGNGGFYGGSGDGAGDGGQGVKQDDEFGPILNEERVLQEVQSRGITLPPDMLEAAKTVGIQQLLLSRYIELQGASWPLGPAIRGSALLRNRMLADPTFLFKVFTEVAIDSGCATFAEIQKRGKDFWNEFELYLSDLSVGIVLDVALVGLLAPFVQFKPISGASGTRARLSRAIQALPSSMFEAQRPGRTFSLQQRVATLFYKAGQYGVAGFACGMVGQGLASSVMTIKRKMKKSEEEEIEVPSVVKSAALWAVFMGVSSNTRYQIINGLERVVEASVVSKKVPQIAAVFTVGIRFANNIYGGMQFVDWARFAGVQ